MEPEHFSENKLRILILVLKAVARHILSFYAEMSSQRPSPQLGTARVVVGPSRGRTS